VKVDAFDYSRYGSLPGDVSEISPTTIRPREGEPFYEARISLERSQFEIHSQVLSVSSGMTGEADIRTGRKTVFQYMWKPVFTTFKTAFSER
jgi:membrane fusion protein, adhesin transport system